MWYKINYELIKSVVIKLQQKNPQANKTRMLGFTKKGIDINIDKILKKKFLKLIFSKVL